MSLTTILKTAPSRLPQYEELDLSDNIMYPQQIRSVVRDIKLVNFYGNEQIIKTGRGPRFRIRYDQITRAQLEQIEKWEQERIPVTFNGNYDASTWLLFNFFRAGRDAVTLEPLIELTKDPFTWSYDRTTTNSNASYILDDQFDPAHEYVADDVPRFAEGWQGLPGIICESYTQQLTAPSHPDTGDNVWVGASGSPVISLSSSDSHYTGMAKTLYVAMNDTEAIEWQSPIYSAWAGANITDTDCSFSVYVKGEGTVRLQANNSLVLSPPVNGPATVLTGKWQRLVLERIFINKVAGNRLDIEIQNNSGSNVWFHVGGAQLEQGRPVSSYLHTVGSTDPVRTSDRISAASGAAPHGQEGTIFAGLSHPQDTYSYDTGSPSGGVYASEYLLFSESAHPNFFGIAWRPSQKKWTLSRIGVIMMSGRSTKMQHKSHNRPFHSYSVQTLARFTSALVDGQALSMLLEYRRQSKAQGFFLGFVGIAR